MAGTVTRGHRGFTLRTPLWRRSIIPAGRVALADWLQLRRAFLPL